MKDDEQFHVTNEPVATGALRTELRGNVDAAMGHVRGARRMLGQLRTQYGINERIAAGEPGGYYKQHQRLPDGSLVEVLSNNGNDTIRITSPQVLRPVATQGAPAVSEGVVEGRQTSAAAAPHVVPEGDEPPPLPKRREEEEEEENPVDEYRPYLWIGARIKDGPKDEDGNYKEKLHVCVWEPPLEKDGKREILSNRNDLVTYYGSASEKEYPLQSWKQFTPAENPETDWINGLAYTDQKLFMLLERNGYPMRIPGYQDGEDEDIEWDVIFISDPDNELDIQTEKGPMAGTSAGGTFYVKIMVQGPDCGPDSRGSVDVELRIITGKDGYVNDTSHEFTITQFTDYKMGVLPLGWFAGDPYTPSNPCTACHTPAQDWGTNRHGPHWWQGMATVELAPAQVDTPALWLATSTTAYKDEVDLPPTGFEPADWFSRADLCPACLVTYYDGSALAGFGEIVSTCEDHTGPGCTLYEDASAWISSDFWLDDRSVIYGAMKNAGINSLTLTDEIYGVSADVALHYWTGPGEPPYDHDPDPCEYPFGVNFRVFSHLRVMYIDEDCHATAWELARRAAFAAFDADPKYSDPHYHGPDPINDFNMANWGMPDGWNGKAYVLVKQEYDANGELVKETAQVVGKEEFLAKIATTQCAKVEDPN